MYQSQYSWLTISNQHKTIPVAHRGCNCTIILPVSLLSDLTVFQIHWHGPKLGISLGCLLWWAPKLLGPGEAEQSPLSPAPWGTAWAHHGHRLQNVLHWMGPPGMVPQIYAVLTALDGKFLPAACQSDHPKLPKLYVVVGSTYIYMYIWFVLNSISIKEKKSLSLKWEKKLGQPKKTHKAGIPTLHPQCCKPTGLNCCVPRTEQPHLLSAI